VFDTLSASLVSLSIKFLEHAASLQSSFSGPSLAILDLLKPIWTLIDDGDWLI
jgi:hypothetical protein